MFALVTNAIQNAADVVSPPPSPFDQFVWHWNRIQDFYLDEKSDHRHCRPRDRLIEDTMVPRHLNQIMRMLLEEDVRLQQDEQANRVTNTQLSIGPCLEFVLQNRLLEMLCTLAEADEPPGTCLHVFLFLRRLIADCSVNLLGHNSLINSVHRLIAMCSSAIAGPYERTQAEFLAVITLRLQTHRHLIQCFTRDGFPLCVALLSLLTSPDNEVSTKVADMLIVLVFIADDELSQILISQVSFTQKLVQLLMQVHSVIPLNLQLLEVEKFLCTFSDNSESMFKSQTVSNDTRKFLCFMRWFCFYDSLVQRCSSSKLSKALCDAFENDFLKAFIQQLYISDSDSANALLQTFLLIHCVRNCASNQLLNAFNHFIFDSNQIQNVLFNRCLSDSNQNNVNLNVYSLQFLEELISKADCDLLTKLLILPIVDRSYIDIQLYNLNADLLDLEKSSNFQTLIDKESKNVECSKHQCAQYDPNEFNAYKFKSLNYFIDLIPDELRSGPSAPDFGLQTYIEEAKKHFNCKLIKCASWNWPKSISVAPLQQTLPFDEGDLFRMCFKNLRKLLNLSYETSLQVTSLISKIALYPHANLNEYLLNPSIPLRSDCQSLFSVLHEVVDELQISVAGIRDLKSKLYQVRQSLLGQSVNDASTVHQSNLQITDHEKKVLETLVIVEEFGKELAAIAFVQNHYFI